MSDDKNKIGEMFEKAFANRKLVAKEKKQDEENEKEENERKNIDNEQKREEKSKEEIIKTFTDIETQKEVKVEPQKQEEVKKVEEEQSYELMEEYNEDYEEEFEDEELEEGLEGVKPDNQTTMIKIEELEDFPNQPFKEYSEEKEKEMIDSIKVNGIINDLIVRPLENGKYQILSGHNRKNCAKKVGLKELPCKIKDVDDDTAQLMLVDTNLVQRKDFFPSETAKALKIKKEIYKKKKVDSNFFDEISKEQKMSRGNIQRYLRLNFLIPEIMTRVDDGEMTIKIAEDISFLTKEEQQKLDSMLEAKPHKITINQAKRLREESDDNNLTERTLKGILENEEKEVNKDIEIKFTKEETEKYFKNFENIKEIKEFIISMLEEFEINPNNEEIIHG